MALGLSAAQIRSPKKCEIGNAIASGDLKWQYIAIIATFCSLFLVFDIVWLVKLADRRLLCAHQILRIVVLNIAFRVVVVTLATHSWGQTLSRQLGKHVPHS